MLLMLHLGVVFGSYPLVLKVKGTMAKFIIQLKMLSKVEHIYFSSNKTI